MDCYHAARAFPQDEDVMQNERMIILCREFGNGGDSKDITKVTGKDFAGTEAWWPEGLVPGLAL